MSTLLIFTFTAVVITAAVGVSEKLLTKGAKEFLYELF